MTLQICMACPAHILASTELRAVTNARGTSDNDHSSQADLYPLGHSGLLTGAMGIWNSRDNVFTSAAEPNCAKGACVSPDFRLQNVAVLLAGGPCKSDGASRISVRLSAASLTLEGHRMDRRPVGRRRLPKRCRDPAVVPIRRRPPACRPTARDARCRSSAGLRRAERAWRAALGNVQPDRTAEVVVSAVCVDDAAADGAAG